MEVQQNDKDRLLMQFIEIVLQSNQKQIKGYSDELMKQIKENTTESTLIKFYDLKIKHIKDNKTEQEILDELLKNYFTEDIKNKLLFLNEWSNYFLEVIQKNWIYYKSLEEIQKSKISKQLGSVLNEIQNLSNNEQIFNNVKEISSLTDIQISDFVQSSVALKNISQMYRYYKAQNVNEFIEAFNKVIKYFVSKDSSPNFVEKELTIFLNNNFQWLNNENKGLNHIITFTVQQFILLKRQLYSYLVPIVDFLNDRDILNDEIISSIVQQLQRNKVQVPSQLLSFYYQLNQQQFRKNPKKRFIFQSNLQKTLQTNEKKEMNIWLLAIQYEKDFGNSLKCSIIYNNAIKYIEDNLEEFEESYQNCVQ